MYQRPSRRDVGSSAVAAGRPSDAALVGLVDALLRVHLEHASVMLVLATEDSNVQGFTLQPEVGEFFLTHPDMKMPEVGKTYAVNQSREPHWSPEMVEVVQRFRDDKVDGKKRTARYVGSLIADFHRTLLKGGIFMYPGEVEKPEGKLRLMYEAAPLAMLAEKAGGAAHDGRERILDKIATTLHERTPNSSTACMNASVTRTEWFAFWKKTES